MQMPKDLNKYVTLFKEELQHRLVGVYLHGSLAMGCFNPEISDVDLLVVVDEAPSVPTKRSIINKLLHLTKESTNPLEMSIITKNTLTPFIYPTLFELHYFHPDYLLGTDYICGGPGFSDPDLAGHIMVTYYRGITLYGDVIKKVFKPVPYQNYVSSILNDIKDAPEGIITQPVYFTLNLCRVLYFLKKGIISSKREGGEWGIKYFSNTDAAIVSQCLDYYSGSRLSVDIKKKSLVAFASEKVSEIMKLVQVG